MVIMDALMRDESANDDIPTHPAPSRPGLPRGFVHALLLSDERPDAVSGPSGNGRAARVCVCV